MAEISIGTHDGKFHADEVFACAALRTVYPTAEIIRTRDLSRLDRCTFCVDVGGVYDPGRHRYDHHQERFEGRRKNGVKYSSFGLVWRHFGEEVVGSSECAQMVDERLVQGIDAADTAQSLFEARTNARFRGASGDAITSTSVSAAIASMNALRVTDDGAFMQAVRVADILLRASIEEARQIANAKEVVFESIQTALREAYNRVLVLDRGMPWKTALFVYEKEYGRTPLLFVVIPCEEDAKQSFIQTLPEASADDRRSRKVLPREWLNLSVQKSLGITFCHRDLFFAKVESVRAIELANQAVMAA